MSCDTWHTARQDAAEQSKAYDTSRKSLVRQGLQQDSANHQQYAQKMSEKTVQALPTIQRANRRTHTHTRVRHGCYTKQSNARMGPLRYQQKYYVEIA